MEKRLLGATALASVALVLAGCSTNRGASQDPNALVAPLHPRLLQQPARQDAGAGRPRRVRDQTWRDPVAGDGARHRPDLEDPAAGVLRHAPGRLDDRQPGGQADCRSGCAGSAGRLRRPADGFAPGIVDATSLDGKLFGLAPVVNTSRWMSTPRHWPMPTSPRPRPGQSCVTRRRS